MKLSEKYLKAGLVLLITLSGISFSFGQSLPDFEVEDSKKTTGTIEREIQFNGYTNHWQNNYTNWYRYGNLFKIAAPDIQKTILQSKVDAADDLKIPDLLMQEGFLFELFAHLYTSLDNPTLTELENELLKGDVLVLINSTSELGKQLESKAESIFLWAEKLQSYQFGAVDYEKIKAFYLVNGNHRLFVISSDSAEKRHALLQEIESTKEILAQYKLFKGWFGASTLLKSVTCEQGHPLDLIGIGMNEGNSWFIFDGYMDFLAKDEIETWVKEVNLPVVANVGFSPVYGCENYEGLQVQDMATKQSWIDYARKKGGYTFRPVYDPESDSFDFDGYIAMEGNKDQIDNENIPFINKTGFLSGNLTSSMVLFIEKDKSLTNSSIWDAIMDRREVAVLDKAKLMGPDRFRKTLQLLYLDKQYLEEYFGDNIDIRTEMDGYDLLVTLENYYPVEVSGDLAITPPQGLQIVNGFSGSIVLKVNETKTVRIPLRVTKEAMGKTNPVAIRFSWADKNKNTVAKLDLPPAISVHQLLYGHAPKVLYPVSIHNFTKQNSFPVKVDVYQTNNLKKAVFSQTKSCNAETATHRELNFELELPAGEYAVKTSALDVEYTSQLGVGKGEGKPYLYEVDLNSDGIDEYRMENDSVQVTLLRTGARVIEYIVKSKNDNVLFKIWPEKTYNHKRPFRMRGYYPYGGFEDFLGQASMETHQLYNAKIIQKEGDFVRVEMETDYFGNHLKKTFTLYGNSPLLEVRFELDFKNPEANVIGPQPILELGQVHGTEEVFTVPTMDGLKEYRMRPEKYYGQAINVKEGWNAGYDTSEHISFVGAFPVKQPIFLHMWMNHPDNSEAPHYYVEFQPWTPIIQKSTMFFSYYIWGSGDTWENGVMELRKRNLISTR
ncbi:hypothetical protein OU798_23245 [Prolixibacteraceae bacterium Z1-6]|uniref:Uncharacterized protein n=1 Tax=Draconibacterium aestuarii TaxID=2998507 RepID=A0A9X3JA07_9BACT|nr:hypothetical protein [Prolixibacteraceae bacterium Z1-6]